jgi:REP element-mobilizing transposase RayT
MDPVDFTGHAHSVTRLLVHLVWTTRGRNHWLEPERDPWLPAALRPDHVHMLVRLSPRVSTSSLAHGIKGASSVALAAELGQPFRWQAGYFAESVREVHALAVYIGAQREHHRDATVLESWETHASSMP